MLIIHYSYTDPTRGLLHQGVLFSISKKSPGGIFDKTIWRGYEKIKGFWDVIVPVKEKPTNDEIATLFENLCLRKRYSSYEKLCFREAARRLLIR